MGILWDDDAWDDYLYWQTQDKKTLKRINALVKDIERTPYEGIGKPEPLKGNLSGWWSRRIDEKMSSFLDNTPTYLVFLTTAGTLAFTNGITTTLGTVPTKILSAISCGAVFMGANTYIGNAPNFMVKAISDENGVKMPSFFGYMLWSVAFLIPVFIIDMFVFFL